MNEAEIEEAARLKACLDLIQTNLQAISARLDGYARDIQESKTHMWDARRDMDHIEKIAVRQTIEQKMRSGDVVRQQERQLLKLRRSPYFGRFDFQRSGGEERLREAVYVGVHDFQDDETKRIVVHDWRAPISSMFYEYEIGPARYEAPSGEVEGQLQMKRQFRIRDGRLEFVIESGVNIVDDVLQEELSRSSDEGMKNIVSTIQRDQNAIIRDASVHTLIIQGVAGSGKTSIALHRIAFLLYRFKDSLTSDDILIISPNRVFGDYIGNVLPELGEEQVGEIGMEDLAEALLDHKYAFQTFFEQTSQLLETNDGALKARIAAKASLDFLTSMDAYIDHLESESFVATQWRTGRKIVPDWFFAETWRKHRGKTYAERTVQVVETAEHQIRVHYNHELEPDERRSLREAVRGMVRRTTVREAYRKMFEWLGQPELFKPIKGKLEYADVFPLIYLKLCLEGIENPWAEIKHLLIDEMQDYTQVQYALIGRLFKCRKTILGDASQAVSPSSASNADKIQQVLRTSAPVKLNRSYRSTWEIMQFALAISPHDDLVPMKRHGEPPKVIVCQNRAEMVARIMTEVEDFRSSLHQSLAIIAKTQKQAASLHRDLVKAGMEGRLLDAASSGFSGGLIVCTAYLAKGLEFDRVLVPDISEANYHTAMDRNQLYVACTRAMHQLTLIAVGEISSLLPVQATRREMGATSTTLAV